MKHNKMSAGKYNMEYNEIVINNKYGNTSAEKHNMEYNERFINNKYQIMKHVWWKAQYGI